MTTPSDVKPSKNALAFIPLWVWILLLTPAAFTLMLAPDGDEALFLLQGKLITQGWAPYRDFFQFLMPGLFYGIAGIFSLVGPSVVIARLVTHGLILSALAAVLMLGRPWLRPWTAWALTAYCAIGILSNAYIVSHHAWSGVLAVWSTFHLVAWSKDSTRKSALVYAGLLTALAGLITQSLGALMLAAQLVSIVILAGPSRVKAITRYLAAWAGFILPTLGIMAVLGILPEMIDQTALWLLKGQYSKTNTAGYNVEGFQAIINSVFTLGQGRITGVRPMLIPAGIHLFMLGWLPVLGLLWSLQTLFGLRKNQSPELRPLVCIILAAAASLAATMSYSTIYHLATNGWLGTLLGFMALQSLVGKTRVMQRLVFGALCAMMAFLGGMRALTIGAAMAEPSFWLPSYGTAESRFVSLHGPQRALTSAIATEAIRQMVPAGEPVFIFNVSPQLHLFADRPPATPYLWIMPGFITVDDSKRILEILKNKPPKAIIYDGLDINAITKDVRFQQLSKSEALSLGKVMQWVQKHYYAYSQAAPEYTIFKRISDPISTTRVK